MITDELNERTLYEIATTVRSTAKELSRSNQFSSAFCSFPRGCCGLASWTLAWVLHDLYPSERVSIVHADRNMGHHVWVEIASFWIDITPNQFFDCKDEIIIAPKGKSAFLNSFVFDSYQAVNGTEGKARDDELLYKTVKMKLGYKK